MKFDPFRCGGVLMFALLSGCTSYVTTQVTTFSDWGVNDAPRAYAFARSPEQENSLEQYTYEQYVAQELGQYSFKPAPATKARYWVGLTYSIKSDMATGWGPWGPETSGFVAETYPVYTHTLAIRITERATGREVYHVTAVNADGEGSLALAMPVLVRSALADFPIGNGEVRAVKISPDKHAGTPN